MHIEVWQYIILFIISLIAGWIDSIAGGGGILTLPALISLGLPPHLALGTNKIQGACGSFSALVVHLKKKTITIKEISQAFIFAAVFGAIGAITAQIASAKVLNFIIPALLVVIALFMLINPKAALENKKEKISPKIFFMIAGAIIGFYDGFFGPGTGTFWAFGIIFFLGLEIRKATGITKAMNFASNIGSLILFIIGGNVIITLGLLMGLGQYIGAQVGARTSLKNGGRIIKPLLISVSLILSAKLIYSAFFS